MIFGIMNLVMKNLNLNCFCGFLGIVDLLCDLCICAAYNTAYDTCCNGVWDNLLLVIGNSVRVFRAL